MNNLKKQNMDKWSQFSKAFLQLGNETYGMTDVAAAVLFDTYVSYKRQGKEGAYRGLQCGVPECAILSGVQTIELQSAYSGCRTFWEYEPEYPRARISETGIDYVEKHLSVFMLLS